MATTFKLGWMRNENLYMVDRIKKIIGVCFTDYDWYKSITQKVVWYSALHNHKTTFQFYVDFFSPPLCTESCLVVCSLILHTPSFALNHGIQVKHYGISWFLYFITVTRYCTYCRWISHWDETCQTSERVAQERSLYCLIQTYNHTYLQTIQL